MRELLNEFVFLFAVIDPIGTVPVFIHVASRVMGLIIAAHAMLTGVRTFFDIGG